MSRLRRRFKDIEQTIRRNAAELKKFIDKVVNQLAEKLTENKTAALKTINEERRRLDVSLAAMKSFTRYSRELIKKGKECDVTEAYDTLHKRAIELSKKAGKTNDCCLPDIVVTSNEFYDKISYHILGKNSRKYQYW
jgi:hypothetical protein